MLNFSNLNDVEFEYLCKDVMSKMLGVDFQRFGAGRDGGIDLTDDVSKKNVIVQVKHYVKTDFSGLIASLRKEVKKVECHRPEQYYICCSKELTPQNKHDIYEMFSDYMESAGNIITLIEISDFLEQAENADVLHKHFKLWIESTNILTDIFTKDICIDSEVLLSNIKESAKLFVKTSAYSHAVSCLEKNNVLIIIGNPGVGKTITSQMLVLYYASQGFRVRYTTDGADLASLKRSLSQSSDTKEVILLDDCFGQAYFNMKETQENELLTLIKYVKTNPNKLLIMNSRVTIYQEAKARTSDLVKSLDRKEYKAFVLDMTYISAVEKAKILYNHLFFCQVPQSYRDDIRLNKNYFKVVQHENYNPRIIEFVTNKRQYETVEASTYSDFIIQCLDNPEEIWKNEYDRRLNSTDRMLLNTLYSLTSTTIPLEVVKACYEHRISMTEGIDSSINHFEQSLRRLQDSMVKVVDVNGKQMLSVANPSINDFLSAYLDKNIPEKKAILAASCCVWQLKRLLSEEQYKVKLRQIFDDRTIINYIFESDNDRIGFITYCCVENSVLIKDYRIYLEEFVCNPQDVNIFEKAKLSVSVIFKKLFEKKICSFYGIDNIVLDMHNLSKIILLLDLDNAVEFINQIDYLFEGELRSQYVETVVSAYKQIIEWYCSYVPADEFDVDIGYIIDGCMYEDQRGGHINCDEAVWEIENIVRDAILDEVDDWISKLPKDIIIGEAFMDNLIVDVIGASGLVEAYLLDDYPDDYYREYDEREFVLPEIEYIFER